MRSAFGTVTVRKDRNGEATSLVARYVKPIDRSKHVRKHFDLGSLAVALNCPDR